MSGTETPSSSPITSASLKSNSLFKGDVSQEVIDMMAKIGVSLKGDMLCQTSTNEELMDFHGGHSHHVDNQAIYLCVYQGAVTIPGEDARVLRIGGLDDANTYWYSNISSDLAGRVNLGEKKIVSGREELEKLGFSLPNSSAIALDTIPMRLKILYEGTVPSVEDIRTQEAEIKALGSTYSGDLTALKQANEKLRQMLEDFIGVKGNEIWITANGYPNKTKVSRVECDNGLLLLELDIPEQVVSQNKKGPQISSWTSIDFNDEGSKRLGHLKS